MTNISDSLNQRKALAADYISEHGWTQGKDVDDDGRVCLTGAIRLCSPQNGDEQLLVQVMRHRKRGERWNDTKKRTKVQVIKALKSGDVTDDELAEVFGPQWLHIVALVRRAAVLTPGDVEKLYASRAASWAASWDAPLDAPLDASRAASLAASWAASRAASRDASRAASLAASALSIRDLIGSHGFTQEHYDTLTGPWRKVIGKVHPDDADILEAS